MCCGLKSNLTDHHAIPQRMEPQENCIVVVCRDCHDKIHSDDIEGLKGMIHKGHIMMKRAYEKIANYTIGDKITFKKRKKW